MGAYCVIGIIVARILINRACDRHPNGIFCLLSMTIKIQKTTLNLRRKQYLNYRDVVPYIILNYHNIIF